VESFDLLARSHSTRQLEARREHSRAQQHDCNLPATRQQPIQRHDDPGFVIQRGNPSWLGRRLVRLRHAWKLKERHPLMLDKSRRTGLKRPGAHDSPDHNRRLLAVAGSSGQTYRSEGIHATGRFGRTGSAGD
jgi:hypothetical protein